MSQILDRDRSAPGDVGVGRARVRPILLGTLSVRVEPAAERMAIDTALESGAKLIVANMMALPPLPLTLKLAPQYATLPHEGDVEAVRGTAERAAALGIATELLRVTTPRPVTALIELCGECEAGLLVFGPDVSLIGRLRFRRAARRVRRDAPCLVWVAPDG